MNERAVVILKKCNERRDFQFKKGNNIFLKSWLLQVLCCEL